MQSVSLLHLRNHLKKPCHQMCENCALSREKVHVLSGRPVHDQNVSIREEYVMDQDQRNLHVDQFVKVDSEKGSLF